MIEQRSLGATLVIVGDDAAEVGAAVARFAGQRILAFVGSGGDEALVEMLTELAPEAAETTDPSTGS